MTRRHGAQGLRRRRARGALQKGERWAFIGEKLRCKSAQTSSKHFSPRQSARASSALENRAIGDRQIDLHRLANRSRRLPPCHTCTPCLIYMYATDERCVGQVIATPYALCHGRLCDSRRSTVAPAGPECAIFCTGCLVDLEVRVSTDLDHFRLVRQPATCMRELSSSHRPVDMCHVTRYTFP